MTQLYPLLMQPLFDPRPWGTLDLSAIYPNHKFNERIGEAWLTGDNCVSHKRPAGETLARRPEQRIRRRTRGHGGAATRNAFRC